MIYLQTYPGICLSYILKSFLTVGQLGPKFIKSTKMGRYLVDQKPAEKITSGKVPWSED
jgi:hypothetical protein